MEPHKIVSRRGVDEGAQSISRQGEGVHPGARPLKRRTARASLGQSRQGLCVRYARRKEDASRAVRRQKPAHRLPFHARPGLGGRLPELLLPRRSFRRRQHPPRPARRDFRRHLPRAARRDRSLQARAWAGTSLGCRHSAAISTSISTCPSRTTRSARTATTITSGRRSSATRCRARASSTRTRPAPYSTPIRPMRAASTFCVGAYNFLDLTPKGRDEAELPWTMAWVRHHDKYESAKPSHSCCAGAAE